MWGTGYDMHSQRCCELDKKKKDRNDCQARTHIKLNGTLIDLRETERGSPWLPVLKPLKPYGKAA